MTEQNRAVIFMGKINGQETYQLINLANNKLFQREYDNSLSIEEFLDETASLFYEKMPRTREVPSRLDFRNGCLVVEKVLQTERVEELHARGLYDRMQDKLSRAILAYQVRGN